MSESESLSLVFDAPPAVAQNGVARLQWQTSGAESCVLDPGNETLPASGEKSVTVDRTTYFTITARSESGALVQSQREVTVGNIEGVAPDPTLLTYALSSTPNPLRISTESVLKLVVSNPGDEEIYVESIVLTLPAGTNASDLIASGAGIQSERPADWTVTNQNGVLTCKPNGGQAKIEGGGLSFTFSRLTTNAQVGTCDINIAEKAGTATQKATRRTSLRVSKFPVDFEIKTFTADPTEVPWGGSTTLSWKGSTFAGVNYKLTYQPADQGPAQSLPVENVGTHVSKELTRSGGVTFTLTVTLPNPSGDTPLTVQKQLSVSVLTLSVSMVVLPTNVGPNGMAWVQWESANAVSCVLDPGSVELPTSGSRYIVVPRTTQVTITARNRAGKMKQEQRTIQVDPNIKPNIAGHTIAGGKGGPGSPGRDDPRGMSPPGNGGRGGGGGEAKLTAKVPPFDTRSNPTRVMPISLTGGDGGNGGRGGSDNSFNPQQPGGNGGDGGPGGNATVAMTFDPAAGEPAQFILTLTGGKGGEGGERGYGSDAGANGRPGSNGGIYIVPS